MTEVPKIVYQRLRAALSGADAAVRSHPNADILTAFTEQSLPVPERLEVLEHLAFCPECREVVHLALPASEATSPPLAAGADAAPVQPIPVTAERKWLTSTRFAWPSLRWAALAAAVVVAASVLVLRPGKLNQPVPASVNPEIATSVPPASGPQFASSSADQSSPSAKTGEVQPALRMRSSGKSNFGQPAAPSHQYQYRAESGMLLADNKLPEHKKDSAVQDKLSAESSAGVRALDAQVSRSANETVTVTAEAPAAQAAAAPMPSATGTLMARNDAPAIEKAKPALRAQELRAKEMDASELQKDESQTESQTNERLKTGTAAAVGGSLGQSPGRDSANAAKLASAAGPAQTHITWTITAGVLQRSLDSGHTWQAALHPGHSLLCYASHDQDVWAGGQAGTLYRSPNGGLTWIEVHPSMKARTLNSDVTNIEITGTTEITISTINHEIWSSSDGGKLWEKK
jgi:hypothetical protein